MSVYLLNLIFDTSDTDGLFMDYSNTPPNPLNRSKTWLTCPDPASFQNFNALTASWTDQGGDGTVLISKQATPNPVCVRIASNTTLSNATLRLSVVFGRLHKNQNFASPFTLNNASSGASCTVFDSHFDSPQLSDGSWFYLLRPLVIAPGNSGLVYKFEFLVGVTLNSGQMTFGHDPEMDIEM